MIPTDVKALPQWKGRPVPWVARWSGEVLKEPVRLVRGNNGGTPYFTYESKQEIRDEWGVLWLAEGVGRKGEPEFKFVNTYRQRASMRRKLCQVCGSHIESADTPWLLDQTEWESFQVAQAGGFPIITVVAPTCLNCVELATNVCPQLRKGAVLLNVHDYHLWGVHGEVVLNGRRSLGAVAYDEQPVRRKLVVARQQLVQLDDWQLVLEDKGEEE